MKKEYLMRLKNKLYGPFLWVGFNCLKATEPLQGYFWFLQFSSQEFLLLNWSTLEGWKDELNLKPPSGFQSAF